MRSAVPRKIDRAVVILPTYNEAVSLPLVLDAIMDLPRRLDVLVVDDASPDGTAEKVRSHPEFEKRIFLKLRPAKMGLASAYQDGFQWGLAEGYDVCMEMDSDLSHDPKDIPRLLEVIEQGADIALGSRYLNGISVVNWPLRRLMVSIGAGIYTRFITGMPLTDPTGGFKAIHKNVIERLNWSEVKSEGYGFQIEVSFFAHQSGFVIREIPIVFTERRDGESKFSMAIALEASLRVLTLGFSRFFKAWKNLNPDALPGGAYHPSYSGSLGDKKSGIH